MGALGFLGWPCIRLAIEVFDTQHGNQQKAEVVTCNIHGQEREVPTSATIMISFDKGGSATVHVAFDECENDTASIYAVARSIEIEDFVQPHTPVASNYIRKDNTIARGHKK
ncbi:unnamed protein product [Sphacelaria rigidula]